MLVALAVATAATETPDAWSFLGAVVRLDGGSGVAGAVVLAVTLLSAASSVLLAGAVVNAVLAE